METLSFSILSLSRAFNELQLKTNKTEGSNYKYSIPFKDGKKKSHYLHVHSDVIRIQSADYPISILVLRC